MDAFECSLVVQDAAHVAFGEKVGAWVSDAAEMVVWSQPFQAATVMAAAAESQQDEEEEQEDDEEYDSQGSRTQSSHGGLWALVSYCSWALCWSSLTSAWIFQW